MTLAIKIEDLFKEYRLGVIGHGTLYRDLQSWWAQLRNLPDPNSLLFSNRSNLEKKRFFALSNISLEVKQGKILGVIGANGAGKSTLLKILSRITAPTSGCIRYKGRIASLLEVGTGFHPELTGRENIYLNGTINGMNKVEITKKLDEIVAFAGVEQFLDTPVKRYSTGMHVRLGFAVAAHIDPDILVVDEVLAVGDASFQKKAINKMQDVSNKDGRTVLFVSHNMESIKKLCNKCILLSEGKIIFEGETEKVINRYLVSTSELINKYSGQRNWKKTTAPGNELVKLYSIKVKNSKGELSSKFEVTDPIDIEINYEVLKEKRNLALTLEFLSAINNQVLMRTIDNSRLVEWGKQEPATLGMKTAICKIPKNIFGQGPVTISLRIFIPPFAANLSEQVRVINVIGFEVLDNCLPEGSKGTYPYDWGKELRPEIKWTQDS